MYTINYNVTAITGQYMSSLSLHLQNCDCYDRKNCTIFELHHPTYPIHNVAQIQHIKLC